MALTISAETKNTLTLSNEGKDDTLTWNEAEFTWENADGTWNEPGFTITNESKNSLSVNLEAKNA